MSAGGMTRTNLLKLQHRRFSLSAPKGVKLQFSSYMFQKPVFLELCKLFKLKYRAGNLRIMDISIRCLELLPIRLEISEKSLWYITISTSISNVN